MVSRKGTLLEKEVLRLFKLVGFEPEHSKKIESYEVDVFLEYKGFKIIVECKQYEKSSLSVRNLIHQWESKNKILKADRVLLVLVGSEITHKERSLAETYGIKIWNDEKLDTFLDKAIEHKDRIRAEILEDLGIKTDEVKTRQEEREERERKEQEEFARKQREEWKESERLAVEAKARQEERERKEKRATKKYEKEQREMRKESDRLDDRLDVEAKKKLEKTAIEHKKIKMEIEKKIKIKHGIYLSIGFVIAIYLGTRGGYGNEFIGIVFFVIFFWVWEHNRKKKIEEWKYK